MIRLPLTSSEYFDIIPFFMITNDVKNLRLPSSFILQLYFPLQAFSLKLDLNGKHNSQCTILRTYNILRMSFTQKVTGYQTLDNRNSCCD